LQGGVAQRAVWCVELKRGVACCGVAWHAMLWCAVLCCGVLCYVVVQNTACSQWRVSHTQPSLCLRAVVL
jgi:hypothetical protein